MEPLPAKGTLTNTGVASVETLTQQLGRGLYTIDSLTASGLTLEASDEAKASLTIKDTLSRVRILLLTFLVFIFCILLAALFLRLVLVYNYSTIHCEV